MRGFFPYKVNVDDLMLLIVTGVFVYTWLFWCVHVYDTCMLLVAIATCTCTLWSFSHLSNGTFSLSICPCMYILNYVHVYISLNAETSFDIFLSLRIYWSFCVYFVILQYVHIDQNVTKFWQVVLSIVDCLFFVYLNTSNCN